MLYFYLKKKIRLVIVDFTIIDVQLWSEKFCIVNAINMLLKNNEMEDISLSSKLHKYS